MRMIVRFAKGEKVRYIGHLDLMRAMQRALRRSGVPVAYSAGFNPHMVLSFASAVAVGNTSADEYMDVGLAEGSEALDAQAFVEALRAAAPAGLEILGGIKVEDTYPALMAQVALSDYRVELLQGSPLDWAAQAQALLAQEQVMAWRETKKGKKEIDIRPMVVSLQFNAEQKALNMRLKTGSAANLKPETVMQALCAQAGVPYRIEDYPVHRQALWACRGDQPVSLLALEEA